MASLAASALLCGADVTDEATHKIHTELSYVNTTGNTETEAFSLDFRANRTKGKHESQLDVAMLYGEENNLETKRKLTGEYNYNYKISKLFSFNYLIGYKNDKFSGYNYQFYTGPGAEYLAIDNKTHTLKLQMNILYSIDDSMDKYFDANGDEIKYPYPDGTGHAASVVKGESDDYTGYTLRLDYNWQIAQNLKFIEEATYRGDTGDSDNYFIYSKTALESKINDYFSLGISYKIDYANTPPIGNERTDKTFMTSLIIDY